MRLGGRILLTVMLLMAVLAAALGAARADTASDWQQGQEAWNRADYAAALLHFQSARDAGLDSAAVHYNIAVSQYRLERYEDAAESFALIARGFPPMRALAEYNLGLTAEKRGDADGARGHYLAAHAQAADDPKLRVLASRRLRALESDEVPPASAWTGALGLRAGYDSNVALRDDAGLPAGTTTESPMLDMFATVQSPKPVHAGPVANASLYVVRYADAGEFDQAEIRGAVGYDGRRGPWQWHFGAQVGAGSIGSDAFDRRAGLYTSASRPVGESGVAGFSAQYDDIRAADDDWAGITGNRWLLDGRYTWARREHRVRLRVTYESNDRADAGVSPVRNRWIADYRYLAANDFSYEIGLEYRDSTYDDLEVGRDEQLTSVRAAVGYAASARWLYLLELRASDNQSTDPEFDYDRELISIGVMRLF